MENYVQGEAPIIGVTRSELTAPAMLLASVVALAAVDCKRAMALACGEGLTERQLIESASACRFFLSPEGQGMIHASGLGHDAVRAGLALARTALRRIGLTENDVMNEPPEAWQHMIEKLSLKKSKVLAQIVPGRQEPLFMLDARAA